MFFNLWGNVLWIDIQQTISGLCAYRHCTLRQRTLRDIVRREYVQTRLHCSQQESFQLHDR